MSGLKYEAVAKTTNRIRPSVCSKVQRAHYFRELSHESSIDLFQDTNNVN